MKLRTLFLVLLSSNSWAITFGPVLVKTIKGHDNRIIFATFSPNGEYLVTASDDNNDNIIKRWRTEDWSLYDHHTLKTYSRQVYFPRIEPHKYPKMVISDDNIVKWITKDLNLHYHHTLKIHSRRVYLAKFGPYRYLMMASDDNTTKIWRTDAWKLKETLKGHRGYVSLATFSPDGKYLITPSRDGTVIIWCTKNWSLHKTLKGHSRWVFSVSFSPDGKYLVTVSRDGTTIMWRTKDWSLYKTPENHNHSVRRSANISPDGKYLVTASNDNTAKVWLMPPPESLKWKILKTLIPNYLEKEEKKNISLENFKLFLREKTVSNDLKKLLPAKDKKQISLVSNLLRNYEEYLELFFKMQNPTPPPPQA